jgi:predicted site-specific integrase-resolvase
MPTSDLEPTAGGWLTPAYVALELGVTPKTVQNWCNSGLLRCARLPSGHRRIPGKALEIFKAGGSRQEQDWACTLRERQEDLRQRLRRAKSPQEMSEILMEPME